MMAWFLMLEKNSLESRAMAGTRNAAKIQDGHVLAVPLFCFHLTSDARCISCSNTEQPLAAHPVGILICTSHLGSFLSRTGE